jgi:amidophosphoribosyltransferase
VFDGNYITGDVDTAYLDRIDQLRNDAAKQKADPTAEPNKGEVIGIHNNSVS